MAELEQQIRKIVRSLARENPLTPEDIAKREDVHGLSTWSRKHVLRAIVQATKDLRARGQLGKLRAALLIGTTLLGDSFLTSAERAGTLLGDVARKESFGRFLDELTAETAAVSSPEWKLLNDRLKSYRAYQRVVGALSARSGDVSRLLRTRPRRSVRMVLALTALSFLRNYLAFRILPEVANLIDELGEPEDISSVASLLVALANEYHQLDSFDFAFPTGDLEIRELRALMMYGKALVRQYEVAKLVSLFRYRLEVVSAGNLVFCLRPPFPEFEYSLRLGFIRSEMNRGKALIDTAAGSGGSAISLRAAAERFADKFREDLVELKDDGTDWRRLRLNFPAIPRLYETVKESIFYEDLLYHEQLGQDFLIPLRRKNEPELRLTENLDLETFHGAWRYLQFASLVDISLLRSFNQSDPTIFLNSLVRVAGEESMIELIKGLGISEEQARDFLRLISADVNHLGHLDLQYRPFLRIAQTIVPNKDAPTKPEIIYLPALVCTSNVLRNVQSANKFRLESNASVFVEVAAETLRSRFGKVVTNKRVRGDGATDIDIILLEGNTLYLFECKHSLPPTGPHEMRDIWEEIEYGTQQLETATRILGNPARRQAYLAGWFPGTKLEDTRGSRIVPSVLCSHRIFAGLEYKGIPIRDFASLARLCEDGIIGMGGVTANDEAVMHRYRITRNKDISELDLDDYFSSESKFFKTFSPFMHALSRIEHLDDVTIARETYVYGVELGDWMTHMEALGFARAPDRRQTLAPRSSSEHFTARGSS